jgi:hypothetical protein
MAWTQGQHLEPLHQHSLFFVMGFLEGLKNYLTGAGFEPWSSLLLEYLGLQAWAIGPWLLKILLRGTCLGLGLNPQHRTEKKKKKGR